MLHIVTALSDSAESEVAGAVTAESDILKQRAAASHSDDTTIRNVSSTTITRYNETQARAVKA